MNARITEAARSADANVRMATLNLQSALNWIDAMSDVVATTAEVEALQHTRHAIQTAFALLRRVPPLCGKVSGVVQ